MVKGTVVILQRRRRDPIQTLSEVLGQYEEVLGHCTLQSWGKQWDSLGTVLGTVLDQSSLGTKQSIGWGHWSIGFGTLVWDSGLGTLVLGQSGLGKWSWYINNIGLVGLGTLVLGHHKSWDISLGTRAIGLGTLVLEIGLGTIVLGRWSWAIGLGTTLVLGHWSWDVSLGTL